MVNEKTLEFVRRWNRAKGMRYQVLGKDGDGSAIAKRIESLRSRFGDEEADRYFESKLEDPSVIDIWAVADHWAMQSWLRSNPATKAEPAPAAEGSASSVISLLGKELVSLIGTDLASKIADDAKAEIDRYVAGKTLIKVVECKGERKEIEEMTHEVFEDVLKFVAMNEPVFLTGPAGCGKNVICEQVAKALGLEFYFTNAVTQEYKLTGYGDANGNFVKTQFYDWCVNGGLFMFDEMDASIPEAMLVVNSALANGYFDFPVVGRVRLHESCRVIACGNTWGNGASMEYVGRNQLDGATLDRFAAIPVDYDPRIEEALAGGNADVLRMCREFRRIAREHGLRVIVSYREIKRLHAMVDVAKMDVTRALKYCLVKGLDKDSLRMVANAMGSDVAYKVNLLKIIEEK